MRLRTRKFCHCVDYFVVNMALEKAVIGPLNIYTCRAGIASVDYKKCGMFFVINSDFSRKRDNCCYYGKLIFTWYYTVFIKKSIHSYLLCLCMFAYVRASASFRKRSGIL